jgi:carbonic anhydrase/acetyltransferase-like protein (isoleucine patch superfamily)
MPVYALGDLVPRIDPSAYVHPDAVVIGNVVIGPETTLWPQVVVRGDYGLITIGGRTSIQDGTVVHAGGGLDTTIGDECVVGHLAHLEGCVVESNALVGSGSVVLHRVVVRSWAMVAANAVVAGGLEIPSHALALGIPARIKEGGSRPEEITRAVGLYVANGRRYREELRPVAFP